MKSPYSNYLYRTLDIQEQEPFLTSLVLTQCQAEIWFYYLPENERMGYMFSRIHRLKGTKLTLLWSADRNETSDSNLIPTFLNHASDKQTSLGEAYCMETIW